MDALRIFGRASNFSVGGGAFSPIDGSALPRPGVQLSTPRAPGPAWPGSWGLGLLEQALAEIDSSVRRTDQVSTSVIMILFSQRYRYRPPVAANPPRQGAYRRRREASGCRQAQVSRHCACIWLLANAGRYVGERQGEVPAGPSSVAAIRSARPQIQFWHRAQRLSRVALRLQSARLKLTRCSAEEQVKRRRLAPM